MGGVSMFGSRAVLIDAGPGRAGALAQALRDAAPAGVVSVVPGADSVVAHLDGTVLVADVVAAAEVLLADAAQVRVAGREHVIAVRYDGEDLREVADLTGLSVEAVMARHVGATYTVDFLGFAPGFPYLSGLDPVLHLPRRGTPRTRVAAGSVGVAGAQTCIYPTSSPGGWNLLGVTDVVLFDASNEARPSLLAPGDTVRFEVAR